MTYEQGKAYGWKAPKGFYVIKLAAFSLPFTSETYNKMVVIDNNGGFRVVNEDWEPDDLQELTQAQWNHIWDPNE